MDRVNLFNDDCLKVLKELEKSTIDCIITSPPYFNVKEYSYYESYPIYLEWLKKSIQ